MKSMSGAIVAFCWNCDRGTRLGARRRQVLTSRGSLIDRRPARTAPECRSDRDDAPLSANTEATECSLYAIGATLLHSDGGHESRELRYVFYLGDWDLSGGTS